MDFFCECAGEKYGGSSVSNAEAQAQCVTPRVEMFGEAEIEVIDGAATCNEGHVVHLCGTAKLYSAGHTPDFWPYFGSA